MKNSSQFVGSPKIYHYFLFNSLFIYFYRSQDYGGELKSIEEFHQEQRKYIESEYRDWLVDSNNLKDAPKDKKANSAYLSSKITSFKSLEID